MSQILIIFLCSLLLSFSQNVLFYEGFSTSIDSIPVGWELREGGNCKNLDFSKLETDTSWGVNLYLLKSIPDNPDPTCPTLPTYPFLFINDAKAGPYAINVDTITSPFIDISGATGNLSFSFYSYFRKDTFSREVGKIEIYNKATGEWLTLDSLTKSEGSYYHPVLKTYDITQFQSDSFRFRFIYDDNKWNSGYWAIDEVKIINYTSPDAFPHIIFGDKLYCSDSAYNLTYGVIVKNFVNIPTDTIYVKWFLNNIFLKEDTHNSVILANQEDTFYVTIPSLGKGWHLLKAIVHAKGDFNSSNDTISQNILVETGKQIEYLEDFDTGSFLPTGWWSNVGFDTVSIINGCNYGNHLMMWGYTYTKVQTPTFVIPDSIESVYFSIKYRRGDLDCGEMPDGDDSLIIYWLNNLDGWQELYWFVGGGGASNSFKTLDTVLCVSGICGIKFMFLTKGSGYGFDSWHIDSVFIAPSPAIKINAIIPASSYSASDGKFFYSVSGSIPPLSYSLTPMPPGVLCNNSSCENLPPGNYKFCVSNATCGTNCVNVVIPVSTGFEPYYSKEDSIVKILIFENFLKVKSSHIISLIFLYNMNAKLVYANSPISNEIHIDMTNFSPGLYAICIKTLDGTFIKHHIFLH